MYRRYTGKRKGTKGAQKGRLDAVCRESASFMTSSFLSGVGAPPFLFFTKARRCGGNLHILASQRRRRQLLWRSAGPFSSIPVVFGCVHRDEFSLLAEEVDKMKQDASLQGWLSCVE